MGISELVQQLPQLIGSAVEANPLLGYGAIFAAMFLENLFPPIPSELIMPLGGFYVQQGQLALIPVVLAGLIGTLVPAFDGGFQRLAAWPGLRAALGLSGQGDGRRDRGCAARKPSAQAGHPQIRL
jgi:hypothetical protein